MKYNGTSEIVQDFLLLVEGLADAIDGICIARSEGAHQNHAMDAVQCLLGSPHQKFGALDHLLGLRLQEHVRLFGRMSLVRAAASEYGTPYVVDEYRSADAV